MFEEIGNLAIRGLLSTKAMLIWEFYEAPEELRFPFNGGDEDFIIVLPPDKQIPWAFENLGCCSNSVYRIDAYGRVCVRKDHKDETDEWNWEETDVKLDVNSPWINCVILIPCHA